MPKKRQTKKSTRSRASEVVDACLYAAELCREICEDHDRSRISKREYEAMVYLYDCVEPALGMLPDGKAYPSAINPAPLSWIQWYAQWQRLGWIASNPGKRPPQNRGTEYFLRFLATRGYITLDPKGIPTLTDVGRRSVVGKQPAIWISRGSKAAVEIRPDGVDAIS